LSAANNDVHNMTGRQLCIACAQVTIFFVLIGAAADLYVGDYRGAAGMVGMAIWAWLYARSEAELVRLQQ
jgi:hypothetical protein